MQTQLTRTPDPCRAPSQVACKRPHHSGCPGEEMGSARPCGHQLSLVYWTRLANSSAQATGPHPAVSGHLRQGPARPTLPTGAPEVVLGPGLTAYVTPLHLFARGPRGLTERCRALRRAFLKGGVSGRTPRTHRKTDAQSQARESWRARAQKGVYRGRATQSPDASNNATQLPHRPASQGA